MKKLFLSIILLLCIPILSGCTAQVAGKYNDYNETFSGTINLNMQGDGYLIVHTSPSEVKCKGKGWINYIPWYSYFTGVCRGQKGDAKIKCDDGRIIEGEWTCKSCTTIYGTATTNRGEDITFYITPRKKKIEPIMQQYIKDVENKPNLRTTKKRKRHNYEKTENSLLELF